MTEQATASAPLTRSNFALLRLGPTKLLVPDDDIRVLELAIDVDSNTQPEHGTGWIAFRQQRCPVFSPSSALEWLGKAPAERSICAVLEADGKVFGILCDEAALVAEQKITFVDIPPAMTSPHSLFTQLALYEESLTCMTTAARLWADLQSSRCHDVHPCLEESA